ncbi:DUF2971 domain-containing protein [Lacimicrobium alkaliphilum]|uniref:DUF2971 domain-containing protein n=1 Tax=Lacimicrobium alkaliphilum TaxID=1526571 RepID=A0ABQ1RN23_9ALTE|nr:DUF2971 domain-containing protein [Lacimicrobium alkaliphilum]GGD75376.1 hypothetical protein GCM10011357_33010 [Lacimicrobium alkaliphilum]
MYKYMPLRKEFFANFLVRATQRCALNDPFEVLPSRTWLEEACRHNNHPVDDQSFEDLLDLVTKLNLNTMGIVSLTYRPDNILMWSHYADEHKGVVVEVDENNRKLKNAFGKNEDQELAQNVVYRVDRLQKYEDDKMFMPYLYKSIDWNYEEEQRIVVSNLYTCKYWMYICDDESLAIEAEKNKCIADVYLNTIDRNNRTLSFTSKGLKQPINRLPIVNNPRFMSMFEIPAEAIVSVTFGARSNSSDVDEVITLIKKNPEMKHVKLRHSKLNESAFGID